MTEQEFVNFIEEAMIRPLSDVVDDQIQEAPISPEGKVLLSVTAAAYAVASVAVLRGRIEGATPEQMEESGYFLSLVDRALDLVREEIRQNTLDDDETVSTTSIQ